MAEGLSAAPRLFDRVRAATGLDLRDLCTTDESPRWHAAAVQLAIVTVAVASIDACRRHGARPTAVLGHSFGEYGALVAADVLRFEDAVKLAAARGQEMAAAADGASAMMAVVGLPEDAVRGVCSVLRLSGAVVSVAAYNSPTQVVLTGNRQALRDAASACRDAGASRSRMLTVPFAAHSPQMATVRARLERELRRVRLSRASVPVYSCVTGRPTRDPAELRRLLACSVTAPVRFRQAAAAAVAAGCSSVLEVGSDFPPRLLGLVSDTCSRDLPGRPMPSLAAVAADAHAPHGRIFEPRLSGRR
jgi:[acyl-carrier-protein] S-malonyltransferase